MNPVTVTAGCSVATSVLRIGYVWLSARSYQRRIELEIVRAQKQRDLLSETIRSLPPGSVYCELLPDGRRVIIELPASEAA